MGKARLTILCSSLFILLMAGVAYSQNRIPQFESYGVAKTYKGKNAKPIIDKDSRTFRTRVRYAARSKPNFAGEYILGQIGCGAACRVTFALNARTGRVSWLPFTICCWGPVDAEATKVRLNSRLVVLRGLRNEGNEEYIGDGMTDTHYYQIRNGGFRYIKTIKQ
jgi:hypothetical protein